VNPFSWIKKLMTGAPPKRNPGKKALRGSRTNEKLLPTNSHGKNTKRDGPKRNRDASWA